MQTTDWIFTIAGRKKKFISISPSTVLDAQEKKRLRWEIASELDRDKLPLHACLVVKNSKGILICGESGSGKSTLANFFKTQGYSVEANDFIVAWEKSGKLLAGALDLLEKNLARKYLEINRCYFLKPTDSRDVFRLNKFEFRGFYSVIMQPWQKKISDKFIHNNAFDLVWSRHVCLGNRQTEPRWQNAIKTTFKKQKFCKIGIIGLGVIGQDVTNLLVDNPNIEKLNLYSRNIKRVKAIALDLKSARPKLKIATYRNYEQCIKNSDVLIFSFRSESAAKKLKVQERYGRMSAHIEIVWEYARVIRKAKFKGIILFVSNPVDILGWLIYLFSNINSKREYDWGGLFSNQVYGIGLGLDHSRFEAVSNKEGIEIIGEHGENKWLSIKQGAKLVFYENSKILNKVNFYSNIIRKSTDRVRFGPAHEVSRIVKNILSGRNASLRLSTVSSSGGFWGQVINLNQGIPMQKYSIDLKLRKLLQEFEKQERKILSKSGHFN